MKRFMGFWALTGVLALAGCSGGGGPQDEARTLHRGNDAEPLTLDPHKTTMVRESEIMSDLFLGLFAPGPDGTTVPGLAEHAEVSEDGLIWTFTLREAYWSDGAPITAHDAVLGIHRSLDPATLNTLAINLFMIENARQANAGEIALDEVGVVALDDRRLRLHLAHPAPYLPEILRAYAVPVPSHLIEVHGDDWVQPGIMVSSGPYALSEWRSNSYIRLERNEAFFDAANVCFDTVYYYPTTDRQAAERRVRAGELDLNVDIGTGGPAILEANHPELLRRSPAYRANELIFNTQRAPFDDVRVRRALSLAIDRRFLADQVSRGVSQANWRYMSPDLPGTGEDMMLDFRDRDMQSRREEARALLTEAGFGPDNPLRFTLRIHPGFPLGGPVLQRDWAEIAPWVTAQLLQNDIQLHYASMQAGDFDVGYAGWTPDYADPYAVLYQWESVSGNLNFSQWTDAEFDALMRAAQLEPDPDARLALLGAAERRLLEFHPHAPLSVGVNYDLVRPDITGWIANPFGRNPSRWLCREGIDTDRGP